MIHSLSRQVAAGLLGLALMGGAAFAQSAPVAPTLSQIVTPAHLAVARSVLVEAGLSRSFDAVVPNVISQMTNTLTRTRPELTADVTAIANQLRPDWLKQSDEMLTNGSRILASLMGEDDLKATAAFFASPAGKKYVETQPALLNQLVPAMEGWTQKISEVMVTQLRAEMKKCGKDI